MNEQELRADLQSDYKLWSAADSSMVNDTLTKTLDLPHGIGVFSLSFAGATDAGKLRAAIEIWGNSIRQAVEETTGDEAVSARAKQKAALSLPPTDRKAAGPEDDRQVTGPYFDSRTISTHETHALPTGEIISDRVDELRTQIVDTKKALTHYERELRALIAFKEALYAEDTAYIPTDLA